jgi:hypothetical protein
MMRCTTKTIWWPNSQKPIVDSKNESYFDKVNNPADGMYIETLTNQLAEKALTLFKDIEANGGF